MPIIVDYCEVSPCQWNFTTCKRRVHGLVRGILFIRFSNASPLSYVGESIENIIEYIKSSGQPN